MQAVDAFDPPGSHVRATFNAFGVFACYAVDMGVIAFSNCRFFYMLCWYEAASIVSNIKPVPPLARKKGSIPWLRLLVLLEGHLDGLIGLS